MPLITDVPVENEYGFEIKTQGTITVGAPVQYEYTQFGASGLNNGFIFKNDGTANISFTLNSNAVFTVLPKESLSLITEIRSFTLQAVSNDSSWTMRAFEKVDSNNFASFTFQSNAGAVGNGTYHDVAGYDVLSVQVSIAGASTVTFESSIDANNWTAIQGFNQTVVQQASSTTSSAFFRFNISGIRYFRARISSFSGGTVTVTGIASKGSYQLSMQTSTSTYGNSDSNSASTALQGVGAFNLLYDGTNWVRQRVASAINDSNSGSTLPTISLMGFNGSTWDRVRTVNTGQIVSTIRSSTGGELLITNIGTGTVDGNSLSSNGIIVATNTMAFNGSTFDRVRTGKVYKYMEYLNLVNTGQATVWTPAAGKKFRLMGVSIAVSGISTFHLQDGTTKFHTIRTNTAGTVIFDWGNGYLSTAANTSLNIYNDSAGSLNVWVTAWGTEE